MQKLSPEFKVRQFRDRGKSVTEVSLTYGNRVAATVVFGGNYNVKQAEQEFNKRLREGKLKAKVIDEFSFQAFSNAA